MKRSIITSGVILAASFTLTNCALELVNSDENFNEGIPFEICAGSVDTKTTLDGLATKWASGDAINLFHAATGTAKYVSDGSFATTDAGQKSGLFTGNLASALEADESYDWYALYPYSEYISTPANTGTKGYVTVGGKIQTQDGLNSMAHLCGEVCPLYGIANDVSSDDTPAIEMNHLTSIIEIKVTNNSGRPLTVGNVSFTAPEDIVGTYYIDFVSDPVVYTGSGASYVSSTASLSVKNAEAIANGSSATFYIAVKPFEAVAGNDLKIKVNGYEKIVTVPDRQSVEFSAGKIKTLSFKYDYVVDPASPVWDLSLDSTSEATKDKIAWTSDWADMVCEKAGAGTDSNNHYPGVGQSSTRFYSNSVLTITPKAEKAVTYYTFTATTSGYASALENSTWTNVKASNATLSEPYIVTIVPKDPASPVTAVLFGTTGLTKVEIHTDTAPVFAPVINVAANSISVPATGGSSEIDYTIKNPVDGQVISASSDQTWISGFDYSVDGKITFKVAENTGEERMATITLSYDGATSINMNLTQKSPSTGDSDYFNKVTIAPVDWSGVYIIVYESGTDAYVYSCVDAAKNYVPATISDNTISSSDDIAACTVTIATMEVGYSIKINSGTNINKYISGGSSNGTTFGTAPVANTLVLNDDGTVKISNNTSTSFQFNSAVDNLRFRYFKSAQKSVCLYKLVD